MSEDRNRLSYRNLPVPVLEELLSVKSDAINNVLVVIYPFIGLPFFSRYHRVLKESDHDDRVEFTSSFFALSKTRTSKVS